MDEELRPVSPGRPNRLAVHHLHQRHHPGIDNGQLAIAHHPDLLPVPQHFFLSLGSELVLTVLMGQILLHFRYLHTLHDLPV